MHGRIHSFRSRALLACVPAIGLAMLASSGTATAASHAPANTRAEVRTALEHLLANWHGTSHAVREHATPGTSLKKVKSGNWSGYADDNTASNTYSSITGKWKEPSVKCTSTEALAVFWVGIDGFTSGTVEQDGTLAFCTGSSTTPEYFTWWEMFPSNSIQVVGSTVKPGDAIAASVVKTGTKYALKVTDSTTTANSFSTTQTCAAATCKDTSAEWIAEAPSGSGGIFPLAHFSTWTLTAATVKSGTKSGVIKTFPDDEITMVNSGGTKVLAQPGALNAAGNSFKVTWKASS
jgi:hypothetical protein